MKVFPNEDFPSLRGNDLDDYNSILSKVNLACALVFTLEAAVKITAMRLTYFYDGWNRFDLMCVVGTLVGIATGGEDGGGSVIGILRTLRIVRIMRFSKGLRQIFTAFILSIPKLANVCGILLLLLFVFAVLGIQLFAKTADLDPHGEEANFRSFDVAVLTLIRSMTGEAWNDLMHALAKTRPFYLGVLHRVCVDDMAVDQNFDRWAPFLKQPVECGGQSAYMFFTCYTMVVTYVVLNLFIAVILEGFDDGGRTETEDQLERCVQLWISPKYDPTRKMIIPVEQTLSYLRDCLVASQMGTQMLPRDLKQLSIRRAKALNLKVTREGTLRFSEAVMAAMRVIAANNDDGTLEEFLAVERAYDMHMQTKRKARFAKQRSQTLSSLQGKGTALKIAWAPGNYATMADPLDVDGVPLEEYVAVVHMQASARRMSALAKDREAAAKMEQERQEQNRVLQPPVAG